MPGHDAERTTESLLSGTVAKAGLAQCRAVSIQFHLQDHV